MKMKIETVKLEKMKNREVLLRLLHETDARFKKQKDLATAICFELNEQALLIEGQTKKIEELDKELKTLRARFEDQEFYGDTMRRESLKANQRIDLLCDKLGVEIIYNTGGFELTERIKEKAPD